MQFKSERDGETTGSSGPMNQARALISRQLLHSTSEQDAMEKVCRFAVEYGGVRMAWIGQANEDGRIVPVAAHGQGIDYLSEVYISIDPSRAESRGPTGTAWREQRSVIVPDYFTLITKPWHESASRFGWQSTAVFPVFCAGTVRGLLTVYHVEVNAFNHDMIELFEELTIDVGLIIERFTLMTLREEAHQALLEREREAQRLALVAEKTDNTVVITDAAGLIEWVNAGFTRMTGYTLEEAVGRTPGSLLQGPKTDPDTVEFMRQKVRAGESFSVEVVNYKRDGSPYWMSIDVQALRHTDSGSLEGFIAIQRDVTEKRDREEYIRKLAYLDALTGLPNRMLLTEMVDQYLRADDRPDRVFCMAFLDLDNFKHVNDTLGHGTGDKLLVEVANRLSTCARPQDLFARVGGDEFVLFMPYTSLDEVGERIGVVERLLGERFAVEHHALEVTFSIGIAAYPQHGSDFETLYRVADIAMYSAKNDGRNGTRVFDSTMLERTIRTTMIEASLREGMSRHQMQLYYQPKVRVSDRAVMGVEALVRWRHPELGWVSPAEFIPIAEQSGKMVVLGEWVFRQAMTQMQEWVHEGLLNTRMSVNVSTVQIRHPGFVSMVKCVLRSLNLSGHHVILELTESIAALGHAYLDEVFHELREMGIVIAIDDFGTGYSSLSYLTRFRPELVKIDKSFVQNMEYSSQDEAIVRAILDMGRSLNATIIAEGVETQQQLDLLMHRGCDVVQGYLFARPQASHQIGQWLRNWSSTRETASGQDALSASEP